MFDFLNKVYHPSVYKLRSGDFANLQLNTDIPGRKEWWAHMMAEFEKVELFILTFNADKTISSDERAGAGYHYDKGCNYIEQPYIPEFMPAPYKVEGNVVTFPSDRTFALFVHECQHFMHLYHDHGHCMAPGLDDEVLRDWYEQENFQGRTHEVLRKYEYEACYRAVFYGKMYKMFPACNDNFIAQINNMFVHDIELSSEERREKLAKLITDGTGVKVTGWNQVDNVEDGIKVQKWIEDNILLKVKSITSWADQNHTIPLLDEE